jgi:hypothetical protein
MIKSPMGDPTDHLWMCTLNMMDEADATFSRKITEVRRMEVIDNPQKTAEIACIAFEGDVDLMALQLESIEKLLEINNFPQIHVILNGKNNYTLEKILKKLTHSLSNNIKDRITYVHASQLCPGSTGWLGQQVLKILIAQHVSTPFHIILDAKNHFVKNCGVDNFFTSNGLPKTEFSHPPPGRLSRLNAALEYFNVKSNFAITNAMPNITPYVFYTDLVCALIEEIEKREKVPFVNAFLDKLETTEFLIYYAFLLARHGTVAQHYEAAPFVCKTLFKNTPSDEEAANKLIQDIREPSVIMFGLHRKRIRNLTYPQRKAIKRIWEEAGLSITPSLSHTWRQMMLNFYASGLS